MRKLVVDIISLLLILLFIYAAFSKLFEYQKFKIQLGQSPMLTGISWLVAWAIPAIEIAASFLLLRRRLRIYGLYASFILMTMFTTYIAVILRFSDFVPCSCGGVLQKMSWNDHFMFNCVFILLAGIAITMEEKEKQDIQQTATV